MTPGTDPQAGGRSRTGGGPLPSGPDRKAALDALVARYERPAFLDDDPVALPHAFDDPADQEVIGLFAALLAWGRRSVILAKGADLVDRMGGRPHRFVMDYRLGGEALAGFKHRTFTPDDAAALTLALQAVLRAHGSLGALFARALPPDAPTIGPALQHVSDTLLTAVPEVPLRSKHLARPSTGSACKRLSMYARWMVRPGPVDLGIWAGVRPGQLVIPLDVHTGRQGRRLGLLTRRADDWRAVLELTDACRALDADDPARYDFALFGLGAYDGAPLPGDAAEPSA